MRKIVFMLSAAMFLTAASFAQDGKSIGFGVKAGANFSNLKYEAGDEDESGDMKVGFNGGGFVNIPFGTTFAIQPEVVFSAEGSKDDEDDTKLNMNFINIPIMFQYTASGFYAETGPQIGFLMSAEADDVDVKDAFESTNFSWAIGLGYKLPAGIGFGARYNLGLSNLIKDGTDDFKIKSNTIQVGLSYTFGGK